MAEEQIDSKALRPMAVEQGVPGLRQFNGLILEEADRDLRGQNFIHIVELMKKDPVVSAPMSLYRMMLGRPKWRVVSTPDATEYQKDKAKIINSMLSDMTHSWFSFIREVSSMIEYGFSVHEIVLRRRLKRKGSKYNDGYVGIHSLPIRAQNTVISGWKYSEDGRELVAVEQMIPSPLYDRLVISGIKIPRKKFLLFNTDTHKGNPVGNSPFKACYIPWCYRVDIEERESVGIGRDLQGIFLAEIPPNYLDPDATEAEKATGEMFKAIAAGVQNNEKAGLVLPKQTDYDSKQDMFRYSLLQTSGSRAYNTSDIIARYDRKILTALFADLLSMGQNSVGSFSLADAKSSILAMAIEFRLKEIKDVLDTHLIPLLYEMNGWNSEDGYPEFQFTDLDERDIEKFSSAIQRLAATGMIERDREIMNLVRETIGATPYPDDMPVNEDILTGGAGTQSKTGKSFGNPTGGLNGTANSVSSEDNSVSNLYNG